MKTSIKSIEKLIQKRDRNKKGLSEIVGYTLLIVFAVSMSAVVFGWLRAKVPKQEEKCPIDVSVEIISYTIGQGTLDFDLKNRGLFGINGLSIKIREESRMCSIRKASCANCTVYQPLSNKVLFTKKMEPSELKTINILYYGCKKPTEIELLPMRLMENDYSFCENSIIKEKLE